MTAASLRTSEAFVAHRGVDSNVYYHGYIENMKSRGNESHTTIKDICGNGAICTNDTTDGNADNGHVPDAIITAFIKI